MKKWIVLLLIIAIGLWGFDVSRSTSNEQPQQNLHIHHGDLRLINNQFAVDETTIPNDIIKASEVIQYAEISDVTTEISQRLAHYLNTMLKEAHGEGISNFLINSSFRDFNTQQSVFNEFGGDFALPAGYSEHNSGLAVDIGSSSGPMGLSDEGKWLAQNAWRYGFILRYPEGKTEITGIAFEPWHFRYVGLPHSEIMYTEQWVLEEYITYLQTNGFYKTKNGILVSYYSSIEKAQEALENSNSYELSGDNQQGIIITTKQHE
ncbi:D-Ala-D-Ala carboxypeptidase VanY [Solibacillus sp. R5-41]|uniref:M15 family metallopeptidase n=1 Tax=Solibacillus sp. R5-41 TaxID=2048654 RepID=UPI000C129975|nr:M15 family metallopeptidase [Solibacillus sp. R5-41]ATP39187.1 D-Ala-D-Ala carboxypeptidase VanY [Solibacillus sp. R5-41]